MHFIPYYQFPIVIRSGKEKPLLLQTQGRNENCDIYQTPTRLGASHTQSPHPCESGLLVFIVSVSYIQAQSRKVT